MKKITYFCLIVIIFLNSFHAYAQYENASIIHSLRLVNPNYTGKAINVKRTLDNTTQDIGYTPNGNLDTMALKSFVGNTNGYVMKWYNQMGQGTFCAANTGATQPLIVNNGRIVRLGVNVAIYFDHTSFQENTTITSYPFEMISVSGVNGLTNGAFLKIGDNTNGVAMGMGSNDFTTSGFDFIGVKEKKEFVKAQASFDSGKLHTLGMKVKSNYFRSGTASSDLENVTMYYDGFDSWLESKNYYDDPAWCFCPSWKNTYPINPSNNLIIGGYQAINGVDLYPKHYTSEVILFNQPIADSVRSFLTADQMAHYSLTISPDDYEFVDEDEILARENVHDLTKILDWIADNMRLQNIDYCWRDSYTRGVGVTRSACDPGYEKIGFLCYPNCDAQHPRGLLDYCYGECPSGFTYLGPTCIKNASTLWGWNSKLADCPEGWTNMGLTCFQNVESYYAPSRLADCPGGYTNMGLTCYKPWSVPVDDFPLSDSRATCPSGYFKGLLGRCYVECRTGFTNNGEFCGLGGSSTGIPSDACPPGFFKGPAERCYRNCPAGYANRGETCQSDVDWRSNTSYRRGNTVLTCPPGYEKDATGGPVGMCYTPCDSSFSGSSFVCWRDCFEGWTNCGFGCAKTEQICAQSTAQMIISTGSLLYNIYTFGLAKKVENVIYRGTDIAIIKGQELVSKNMSFAKKITTTYSNIKNSLTKPVFQSINTTDRYLRKKVFTYRYVRETRGWFNGTFGSKKTLVSSLKSNAKMLPLEFFKDLVEYKNTCEADFVNMTSQAINNEINNRFDSSTAIAIKKAYAMRVLFKLIAADETPSQEMREYAATIISFLDPTGIVDVIEAFNKPKCKKYLIEFPVLSKSYINTN